jgi:hypothetical protein
MVSIGQDVAAETAGVLKHPDSETGLPSKPNGRHSDGHKFTDDAQRRHR